MPKHFKRLLIVTIFSAAVALFGSQEKLVPPPSVPDDNSKESAVIQSMHVTVRYENDGTATHEHTFQVLLQSEAGVQQYGLLTFGYSSANEQIQIGYVRVRKPDGTVIPTPLEDIQDMPSDITRAAPMYSDYREKHLAVKGLGIGDVLEYHVTTKSLHALIPGQFWFDYAFEKDAIVLDEELELNLPQDRFVNVKSTDVKPTQREEGGRRIYLWKASNTKRKAADDDVPPATPPPPPVQVTTFRTWEEVGKWWGGLEQERVTPTPDIRTKAAELTRDSKTDAEKVKAIYHYVATQFRYISVSFGIGRYQPHAADEVLKNAYGDCKDKHTLLASLLDAAGLEAYPALINSTGKIDPEVPSPGHFNHVISVVPLGKDWVWLDTTSEVAPYAFLMINLRDKNALVIPADKAASLMKTPPDPPFMSTVTFQVDGTLDDAGTLKAKIERADRGDTEVIFRVAFRQTPQSSWKDLVQRISYASGFAGDVSEVSVSSPEATDEPFRVSYQYNRKEYPDWGNHLISAPLHICSLLGVDDKVLKLTEPLRMMGPAEFVCKSRIVAPTGYTPQLLPSLDLVRDFAEFHSTYAFKDGGFDAERRLTVKKRELPTDRLEDYKTLQKAVNDEGNQLTPFSIGKGDLVARANTMSADDLNSAAATLIDQNKEIPVARDLLVMATAKDPKHKFAWNNLGRANRAMGRQEEAETAFKKQIEINPKDQYAYKNLASLYTSWKRYDDALALYRKYIEVDPTDKETYGDLGWTLSQMEKWDEAAQAYEKSAEMNPDKPYAYTQWGHVLLKAGKVEDARQKLDRALQVDPSPMTLNNVAWELADASVDLDKAEQEAKSAVDKTAEGLEGPITLQTPPNYDQKLSTLGSFLDTLGWVFYRKGKLDEADSYLITANALSDTSLISEHVAQLRARQDRFDEALQSYAAAQFEPGWTGHADKKLEAYLSEKAGGSEALARRVAESLPSLRDHHLLRPPQGSFAWPADVKDNKPSFVEIVVTTDGTGAVTDSKILNGKGDFRDQAMEDAQHLLLPPISWPGHALATVRTLIFLYRPAGPNSQPKSVKAWWRMGVFPSGNVTLITPDGEHVVNVPPSIAAQMAKTDSTETGSNLPQASSYGSSPGFSDSMQQGLILRRQKLFDNAIAKFREATQAAPDCDWCHSMLAETLLQKGDRAAAIAEYKEVVRITPKNPDAHYILAAQFEAEGATQESTGYHFDPKTHTNRPRSAAMSKAIRTDYESAMQEYGMAHQLAPDIPKYQQAYERQARKLKHP